MRRNGYVLNGDKLYAIFLGLLSIQELKNRRMVEVRNYYLANKSVIVAYMENYLKEQVEKGEVSEAGE